MKNRELIKILKELDLNNPLEEDVIIVINDNCGGGYVLKNVIVIEMQDGTKRIELS